MEDPNHTIPIIDEALFNQAHERMVKKLFPARKQRAYDGLAICNECGNAMSNHTSAGSNGKIHYYYRCRPCGIQISEKAINERFTDAFHQQIKEQCLNADIEIMNKKYEGLEDITETIPKSAFTYFA